MIKVAEFLEVVEMNKRVPSQDWTPANQQEQETPYNHKRNIGLQFHQWEFFRQDQRYPNSHYEKEDCGGGFRRL